MEKKKLKLSVSGSSKRTFNSIEQAKSQSKNAVFIEKKAGRVLRKPFNQKINRGNKAIDCPITSSMTISLLSFSNRPVV